MICCSDIRMRILEENGLPRFILSYYSQIFLSKQKATIKLFAKHPISTNHWFMNILKLEAEEELFEIRKYIVNMIRSSQWLKRFLCSPAAPQPTSPFSYPLFVLSKSVFWRKLKFNLSQCVSYAFFLSVLSQLLLYAHEYFWAVIDTCPCCIQISYTTTIHLCTFVDSYKISPTWSIILVKSGRLTKFTQWY